MSFQRLQDSKFYLTLPTNQKQNTNAYITTKQYQKTNIIEKNGEKIKKPILTEDITAYIEQKNHEGNYLELQIKKNALTNKHEPEAIIFILRFGETTKEIKNQKGAVKFIREKGESEYKIEHINADGNLTLEDGILALEDGRSESPDDNPDGDELNQKYERTLDQEKTYDTQFIEQFFSSDKAKRIYETFQKLSLKADLQKQNQSNQEIKKLSLNLQINQENITLKNNQNLRLTTLENNQDGKYITHQEKYNFQTDHYSGVHQKESTITLSSKVKVENGVTEINAASIAWKINFNQPGKNDNFGHIYFHSYGKNTDDFLVTLNPTSQKNAVSSHVSGIEELNQFIGHTLREKLGNEFIDISIQYPSTAQDDDLQIDNKKTQTQSDMPQSDMPITEQNTNINNKGDNTTPSTENAGKIATVAVPVQWDDNGNPTKFINRDIYRDDQNQYGIKDGNIQSPKETALQKPAETENTTLNDNAWGYSDCIFENYTIGQPYADSLEKCQNLNNPQNNDPDNQHNDPDTTVAKHFQAIEQSLNQYHFWQTEDF